MLGVIVWLGVTFWVLFDAVRRKDEKAAQWTIGTALLFPLVLPVYLANRPLLPGEARQGGRVSVLLKYGALTWTLFSLLIVAGAGTVTVPLFLFWFVPFAFMMGLGFALRKSAEIERGAPLPAGQPRGASLGGFDRRLLWIAPIAVVVVIVLGQKGFLDVGKKDAADEASKQIAVNAVKNRVEPTLRFMALNPDPKAGHWFAVKAAPGYSCTGECFTVFYRVDVMPSTEKKRMDFQWVYDTATGAVQPANTEARTLFVTR